MESPIDLRTLDLQLHTPLTGDVVTNVLSCNLPIFQYSFPQVITKKTCKEYRKSFPQSNTSNVNAWHSDYLTHETTDVFAPLIKLTIDTCNDITHEYYHTNLINGYHYVVNNLWVAMYEKNDYTIKHDHFMSLFSACYYVDVKDNCSPVVFIGSDKEISIQPKTGMLLIWNGTIPHKVEPTKKKRTCICMNIMVSR